VKKRQKGTFSSVLRQNDVKGSEQKMSSTMKNIYITIALLIIVNIFIGCAREEVTALSDHYGEYTFEFPFAVSEIYHGSFLYFASDLTLAEMRALLELDGYFAEIIEDGSRRKVYFTKEKDEKNYAFVIYDKNDSGKYALNNMTNSWKGTYWFRFPNHLIDELSWEITEDETMSYRFYGEYAGVVDFYRKSGRNDFEIKDETQTIVIHCPKRNVLNSRDGYVKIFVTEENGERTICVEPTVK